MRPITNTSNWRASTSSREELAADPGDFNYQYKEADKIIRAWRSTCMRSTSRFNWAYNRAAGYNRWKSLGIDYAFMQPNYYWEADKRPLPQFFSDIKAADLAMEFEFEHTVLESQAGSDVYRKRFCEYMQGAIANGIYGSKPLAYYHGTNALVLPRSRRAPWTASSTTSSASLC